MSGGRNILTDLENQYFFLCSVHRIFPLLHIKFDALNGKHQEISLVIYHMPSLSSKTGG